MTTQDNTPRRTGAQEQFGRQAQHYTRSAGHSSGESLQVVRDWASSARYGRAVDVATGTGFTAFTIAPFADSVVASDLTPEMIAETRKLASEPRSHERGLCARGRRGPAVRGRLARPAHLPDRTPSLYGPEESDH